MVAGFGAAFVRTRNVRLSTINHRGFVSFAEYCTNLEVLELTDNTNLTSGKSIANIAHRCVKLHSVIFGSCSWVTDSDIDILSGNCQKLQKLHLLDCVQITDASLASLSKHCSGLLSLHVKHAVSFPKITDVGILSCQLLHALKWLNARKMSLKNLHVTDEMFADFAAAFAKKEMLGYLP